MRESAFLLVITLTTVFAFQLSPVRTRRPPPCNIMALFNDDPWLTSAARSPLSSESLDALFMYGPIVYSKRCFDAEEYNASVRKIMERYPSISRKLAEQEVHEYLNDPNGYLAQQSEERRRTGPSSDELKPPVGVVERLLVVGWVAILSLAIRVLSALSMTTPKPIMSGVEAATESLLDLPPESLNQMMQ